LGGGESQPQHDRLHPGAAYGFSGGAALPYVDWPVIRSTEPSFLIFPVAGFSMLYPPRSLSPTVGRRDLLLELSPTADDIWFKAMSLLQDVPCFAIGSTKANVRLRYDKDAKLWDINEHGGANKKVLDQVFDHFGLTVETILAKEVALQARK
jgi:hypothetical protein